MRFSGLPTVATWLMTRFVSGEKRESLIGDLIEQHRRGRSAAWYWRQIISAIITGFAAEVWRNRALVIGIVALGTYMGDIYMFIMRASGLRWLDVWYPRLMSWFLKAELDAVWHLADSLHMYAWTTTIEFCAFLAAVVWIASRFRPRQTGLVVTLFLVTQISLCVPYLRIAFTNWLSDPSNPMWFFNLLWFSIFTFFLVPFSIIFGGLYGGRREGGGPLGSTVLIPLMGWFTIDAVAFTNSRMNGAVVFLKRQDLVSQRDWQHRYRLASRCPWPHEVASSPIATALGAGNTHFTRLRETAKRGTETTSRLVESVTYL